MSHPRILEVQIVPSSTTPTCCGGWSGCVVDGSDDEAACPLPINKHLSHKLTFTCSHGLVLLTDLSKHVTC